MLSYFTVEKKSFSTLVDIYANYQHLGQTHLNQAFFIFRCTALTMMKCS